MVISPVADIGVGLNVAEDDDDNCAAAACCFTVSRGDA